MDFSGLESISVEDAAELAEHYTRVASIYARIANTPASPKQTSASLAKQSVMPPAASAAKSGASLSAYMLFAADQRDIIRSENPNLSSQEQIEVISHAWKAASNDLRETYIKRIENTSGSSVASAEPSTTGPKKRAKRTLKDEESTASKKKESHKVKPAVNGASKSAKTKAKKVASDDEEDNDSE
ncbi:hypothetical protein GGI19_004857 [Coemansia pectinata]|uniref:HMG box domain-containing protein n=1 Tax=Coemansia pectinata TaxID=1052879 RepID=A0A9W8GX13_9FUNG|nr:hypothetical protein GGI19_004857 [Coemansia pectinata]